MSDPLSSLAVPVHSAASFRQLDARSIASTLERLRNRIAERFPGSGLSRVATELLAVAGETEALTAYLRRPHWPIRIGVGLLIAAMAVVLVAVVFTVRLPGGVSALSEFVQATEAAISDLVFLGAAVFFLVTIESRLKRRRALDALHQLRSLAHVVDMHQLSKDPERVITPRADTASSPARAMGPAEMGRYLDYCSELLSVTSKIAALHLQAFNDPQALASVSEIENLTAGLSRKIWQKIAILPHAGRAT